MKLSKRLMIFQKVPLNDIKREPNGITPQSHQRNLWPLYI